MSVKKELLEIVTSILKENRAGSKLYFTENKEMRRLKHLLEKTDKWKHAVSISHGIKIKYRVTRGRKYKSLNIMVGDKLIPVTKKAIKELDQEKPNKRALVIAAMREAITPFIQDIKKEELDNLRAFSEKRIISKNYHLDHITPFIKLACDFVQSLGYKSFEDVPGRMTYGQRFLITAAVEKQWYDYHAEKADLRLVTSQVNLKEGSKNYIPPF